MQVARTGNRLQTALKRHWMVYLMAVPVMAYYIVFCYLPMFGIVIAFQDFRVTRGFSAAIGWAWNTLWIILIPFMPGRPSETRSPSVCWG